MRGLIAVQKHHWISLRGKLVSPHQTQIVSNNLGVQQSGSDEGPSQ